MLRMFDILTHFVINLGGKNLMSTKIKYRNMTNGTLMMYLSLRTLLKMNHPIPKKD